MLEILTFFPNLLKGAKPGFPPIYLAAPVEQGSNHNTGLFFMIGLIACVSPYDICRVHRFSVASLSSLL